MRALLLLWALASAPAAAHSPNVASFALEQTAQGWWLEACFPQIALDRALRGWLGDEAVESLSPTAWREAAVAYLKRTVQIRADGAPVALGAGGIRLGEHETDLRLSLPGLPAGARALEVTITSFSEVGAQYNVLRVERAGAGGPEVLDRRVLSPDDGFSERIALAP